MKRSLYLLKKTLILWPNTKKKFEGIKAIISKQKSTTGSSSESPLRFHYTLLNIINILLMYETDERLLPQLPSIFKLLELGQLTPPRFTANSAGHSSQPSSNSIFMTNNIYLMHLLCTIVKRLVKVALTSPNAESPKALLQEIHGWIKEGFDYFVVSTNKTKNQPPKPQANKKIEIEVAISFLKIMFDLNPSIIDSHLNNIKQVALAHKRIFERGFESNNKNNSNNSRVYEPPLLTESTYAEMLQKDLEINIELIKPEQMNAVEENYEKDIIKSYVTKRPLFVVLLRILAAKINDIIVEEQGNTLDIFLTIYEKIPDPELKLEVINILKCLFIGESAFPEGVVPERYRAIPLVIYNENKIFYLLLEDNNKFNLHFEKRKTKPSDPAYNLSEMLYE